VDKLAKHVSGLSLAIHGRLLGTGGRGKLIREGWSDCCRTNRESTTNIERAPHPGPLPTVATARQRGEPGWGGENRFQSLDKAKRVEVTMRRQMPVYFADVGV